MLTNIPWNSWNNLIALMQLTRRLLNKSSYFRILVKQNKTGTADRLEHDRNTRVLSEPASFGRRRAAQTAFYQSPHKGKGRLHGKQNRKCQACWGVELWSLQWCKRSAEKQWGMLVKPTQYLINPPPTVQFTNMSKAEERKEYSGSHISILFSHVP